MTRGICLFLSVCLLVPAASKKEPLPKQYDRWLKEEVTYIITDQERKAFLNLSSNVERDKFIDEFWEVRNPARGSSTNPYKEEHYRRLQYANDNFGRRSGTPGWMTDMGRAWILFGKPVSRAPYTGYSQLYPCELWFYDNKESGPSIPGFFTLLFFMPEDIGEYRFYRPSLDGPLKLVRGSQFNTNADVYKFLRPIAGDLAKAAFTLVPGDPVDTVNFTVDMSSDMMVSRIQNYANDPFNVRKLREMRSLRTRVDSTFLVAQDQPLTIESFVARDLAGNAWVDYSVLVPNASYGKQQPDKKQLLVVTGFRLLTDAGDLIAGDQEERTYDAFGADGAFHPFQISGRLPVLPGKYKLEVSIADRDGSRVYHGTKKIAFNADQAQVSEPLLYASVTRVSKADGTAPFQYFGAQFQPYGRPELPRAKPVQLLYSIELASAPSESYTMEYLIAHAQDTAFRVTAKEEIPAAEFRNGRLLKSKTIPLNELIPGPYRVVLTLRGANGAVLSASTTPIRLTDNAEAATLYMLDTSRATASPAGASYIRALEAIALKDQPAALKYMQQAVELNPGNASAGQYVVEKLFESHLFAPVVNLYQKVGIKPFESSAESLTQISLSFARTGNRQQAQDVLNAARSLFPNHPLLAAASKAVAN